MFSTRLHWDAPLNRLTQTLHQLRADGLPILDLTESNPTRAGLIYPQNTILSALTSPQIMLYEPDPHGLSPARQAVADYYATRKNVVAADDIFLTASTSEAYAFLFKLLCEPGDEILTAQPGYPLLDFLADLECIRQVNFPAYYDPDAGWHLDLVRLHQAITPRSRAIIVVSPNNPTGAYLKADEIAELNALCQAYDLALIIDEVFLDYARPDLVPQPFSMISNPEALTFVLSGLSKVSALPQVKLGWLIVRGPERLTDIAKRRLEWIADSYLSVSAMAQYGAAALIAVGQDLQRQIQDRVAANEVFLQQAIAGNEAIHRLRRDGGWYAVLELDILTSIELWTERLLAKTGVFVHPGEFYGFARDGFIVVSLLTPEAVFQAGVRKMTMHV